MQHTPGLATPAREPTAPWVGWAASLGLWRGGGNPTRTGWGVQITAFAGSLSTLPTFKKGLFKKKVPQQNQFWKSFKTQQSSPLCLLIFPSRGDSLAPHLCLKGNRTIQCCAGDSIRGWAELTVLPPGRWAQSQGFCEDRSPQKPGTLQVPQQELCCFRGWH